MQEGPKSCLKGVIGTPTGDVPRVSTRLTRKDIIGRWLRRWGIGRRSYRIDPGLYGVGNPTAESRVFVTANYKMSFDHLRAALDGMDAWIMVLDTNGINVWCAAGKGTFGTAELVHRVEDVQLAKIVSHKKLILPQLGGPGVAAHEVKAKSGFGVAYGPVRAEDIPAYIENGMQTTPDMRRVRFDFRDRIVLTPMELIPYARYLLLAIPVMFLLAGLRRSGYSLHHATIVGTRSTILLIGAYLAGAFITPALLPWLPGTAFSTKGFAAGIAMFAGFASFCPVHSGLVENWLVTAAWMLLMPAVASFLALQFTGSSTYTSPSGVKREMKYAVPAQITCGILGTALWILGRFF